MEKYKAVTCSILGTPYRVLRIKYEDEPAFKEKGIDGYCDGRLKNIVLCDLKTHPDLKGEPEEYLRECEKVTLRHEIVHAFLNESGLMESATRFCGAWSQNEEMVDWIAIQLPKIVAVCTELEGILQGLSS